MVPPRNVYDITPKDNLPLTRTTWQSGSQLPGLFLQPDHPRVPHLVALPEQVQLLWAFVG